MQTNFNTNVLNTNEAFIRFDCRMDRGDLVIEGLVSSGRYVA